MALDLTKAIESQKKISRLNSDIFEMEIKIEKLEKIKNDKQLFIKQTLSDTSSSCCMRNDFGSRYRCNIIERIEIRDCKYHTADTISVDITKYFISLFSKEYDFLYNSKYMIVNEGDPLWDILVTDCIKNFKDTIAEHKVKIEAIKDGKE